MDRKMKLMVYALKLWSPWAHVLWISAGAAGTALLLGLSQPPRVAIREPHYDVQRARPQAYQPAVQHVSHRRFNLMPQEFRWE
jgi:hypothetical protein